MKDFSHAVRELCRRDGLGSITTRRNRRGMLLAFGEELWAMGYEIRNPYCLKPKHIAALVEKWKSSGLGVGTLKNRLSALRWLAAAVGKASIVPRENEKFGIGSRAPTEDRAQVLDERKVLQLADERVELSVRLMALFGMRVEEALKFIPAECVRGDFVLLRKTKGNRPRVVPVESDAQRAVLRRCRGIAGYSSMIPPEKSYKQWRDYVDNVTLRVGIVVKHGLRHTYGRDRFETHSERLGRKLIAPLRGGLASRSLRGNDRAIDKEARRRVSEELGHSRIGITKVYLG